MKISGSSRDRIAPDVQQMLDAIYVPEWQVISETFIINDIRSFAGQISQLAGDHSLPRLKAWGESLLAACIECDIVRIARFLESFSRLVTDYNEEQDEDCTRDYTN